MEKTHVILLVTYALMNYLPLLHGLLTFCGRSPAEQRLEFQVFFDTFCCRSYLVLMLYVCSLTFAGLLFWVMMVGVAIATILHAVCCPPCVLEHLQSMWLIREPDVVAPTAVEVIVAKVELDVEEDSLSVSTDPLF